MFNCLIFNGSIDGPNFMSSTVRTLGAHRISCSLNDHGYSTKVIDFVSVFSEEELCKIIDDYTNENTIWVGFSSTFFTTNKGLKNDHIFLQKKYKGLAEHIKSKNIAIVYGGSSVNKYETSKYIDVYVSGYADNVVLDVTKYLQTKDASFLPKHDIIVVDGEERIFIDASLGEEPNVKTVNTDWSNTDVVHGESLPIELARGCIFKCKFCSYSLTGKKKGTYVRDLSVVKEELLNNYYTHGVKNYTITDDTFNDDMSKLEDLHKVFTELPFKINFSAFLRIDLMHRYPDQDLLLKEMGLVGAFFGIESFNHESARSIGKGLHPNKVKDKLYLLGSLWKNSVNMTAGMILGLPYDTKEYFRELINWSLSSDNPLASIGFNPLYIRSQIDSKYVSEFSLNPEIYGYTMTDDQERYGWNLQSQDLSFSFCRKLAEYFNSLVNRRNKYSDFQLMTVMDLGIPLEVLLRKNIMQINNQYNIEELQKNKITKYKKLILKI